MSRIELKNCTIKLKDGLAGTAAVNQPGSAPAEDDVSLTIDTVVLNTADTDKVPVGARFTLAGETAATTVHTVTARTPASASPTTSITFSPALGPGTYLDDGVLTFQAQELEIKVGDGDIKYSEAAQYKYDLDRGELDTVREGDEQPMDVSLNIVYEHITTGTSETIAPMDALKQRGSATEWVTSSSDQCEPYAVDIEVLHAPPCGTAQDEKTVFPDFRADKCDVSYKDAAIAISGKSFATAPIVTRI